MAKENQILKKLFPATADRMLTNELIIRYLAVSNNFNKQTNKIEKYDGRIKNLLNNFMKAHQNDDDLSINLLMSKFEEQITKAFEIYDRNAFKKNDKTTKPNASLYECIMIAFEDYSLEQLLRKKSDILTMTEQLLNDECFLKSIDKATGNTEVLNARISNFRIHLGEIMNDAVENSL